MKANANSKSVPNLILDLADLPGMLAAFGVDRDTNRRSPLMKMLGIGHNDFMTLRDFCDIFSLVDGMDRLMGEKDLLVISRGLVSLSAAMKAPVHKFNDGSLSCLDAYRLDVLVTWRFIYEARSTTTAETFTRLTKGASSQTKPPRPPLS